MKFGSINLVKTLTDRALHLNQFTVINELYIFNTGLLHIYNEIEHRGLKTKVL